MVGVGCGAVWVMRSLPASAGCRVQGAGCRGDAAA